jgi:segregation and condensation protein A
MELNVRLEVFEGPLDLLLHLLEKNKVSIYDIPIVEITNQYMDYIREMQRQDLNLMSEFLVMAATLLDIKAKWLLPKEESDEEEETDPRAELVEQLLQYKLYKYMSMELKDRQLDAGRKLYKGPSIPDEVKQYEEPVDLDELTKGYDLNRLHEIFQSVIRKQIDKVDPIRSKFGKIEKEEVSVEEKMSYLEKYACEHRSFSFRSLLEKQNSKVELVVTFLAVLELMKIGKIHIVQENLFDEIYISVTEQPTIEAV